jgi:hypothetical protein
MFKRKMMTKVMGLAATVALGTLYQCGCPSPCGFGVPNLCNLDIPLPTPCGLGGLWSGMFAKGFTDCVWTDVFVDWLNEDLFS